MSMDIVRFRGIFGFLKKFLNAGHTPSFLCLFDPIAYEDMEAFFFIKRESVIHSPEPAAADSIERPGRGSEKVNHGKITVGRERQVSDDGGKPKFNVLSESLCA